MNPLTKVAALMTTELVTVNPSTPLREARELFQANTFHHLPVVDHSGKLLGMLSQSDFVKAHDLARGTVKDLMTTGMAKLETDDTVRTAVSVFSLNRFHALPVVDDNNKLLGIVTTLDLIKLMDREKIELGDYRG